MGAPPKVSLEPRKTPVQARSTATVEAIFEATIQVLLEVGPDRLTTTRVAERAGVSVGTLYQYFPNKDSLLFRVVEQHLSKVVHAVETACQRNHGQPVSTMIESVVNAFLDAKMERSDISMALYPVATGPEATALVNKIEKRGRIALASMLATASDAQFTDLPFTCQMLVSAMGGATRAVLEAGPSPKVVGLLRKQLVLLGQGFLMNVAVQSGR
jgi:AcrR family transcriptional regulator